MLQIYFQIFYIEKASDEQASLLLAEGSMLKGLNHQNICSIVYVCPPEEETDRPFVITPSMNQGNLKNFLKKSRTPEGTGLEKVGISFTPLFHLNVCNYFKYILIFNRCPA